MADQTIEALELLLREAAEEEERARASLLARGVDPAYLDELEAEMLETIGKETTPEEKAEFMALLRGLDADGN
jgi:hypothetical protein